MAKTDRSRVKQLAAELAAAQEAAFAAEEKLKEAEAFIAEHGLILKWEAYQQESACTCPVS